MARKPTSIVYPVGITLPKMVDSPVFMCMPHSKQRCCTSLECFGIGGSECLQSLQLPCHLVLLFLQRGHERRTICSVYPRREGTCLLFRQSDTTGGNTRIGQVTNIGTVLVHDLP